MSEYTYQQIRSFVRVAYINGLAVLLKSYNMLFKHKAQIVYFVNDYPFHIVGLQNALHWKVRGAHKITLNGHPVHPISGSLSYISEPNQKFVLICYYSKGSISKTLAVNPANYSSKKTMAFSRLAGIPSFDTTALNGAGIKKIPADCDLSKIHHLQLSSSMDAVCNPFSNSGLNKLSCDHPFEVIQASLERARCTYDETLIALSSQIFKGKIVPPDYKNLISESLKPTINKS